jgi:hypothetical protein
VARLGPDQHWSSFVAGFAARGKARTRLLAEAIDAKGAVVSNFEGRFVALRAT